MNRIWTYMIAAGVLSAAALAVTDEEIAKMQAAMPDKAVVKTERPRVMLVFSLCKGYSHSCVPYWDKTLDIMAEKTGAFSVEHSTDMAVFAAETLSRFDAVCFNNTTALKFTDEQKKALMDFVKGGKGIVGIHAATDNFPDWPEAQEMMGGVFTGHPWVAQGTWAVKIDDSEHPLMKSFGGKGFKVNDEIYRTAAPLYSRGKQRVLMSLDMSDEATRTAKGVTPEDMDTGISWIKPWGKGRVFYCSLGHNHHLTWDKPVLAHFLAGIQYAMGDLKADDMPLGAPAATVDTAAIEALVEKIKNYEWGQSRTALTELQAVIAQSLHSPALLKTIETVMQPLLQAGVTPAVLDFACRELSVFATDVSVQALAALLDNPETEHPARYALERISDKTVDTVLLEKLKTTQNANVKIGIATTLGRRRCHDAVGALSQMGAGYDAAAALAAVQAMGMIATPEAAQTLMRLAVMPMSDRKAEVLDALSLCADRLAKGGNKDDAIKLYDMLYGEEMPAPVRVAALTGFASIDPQRFNTLLPKAITSEDKFVQSGAIRLVAEVKDAATLEAVVSLMGQLLPQARIQLLAALAAGGSPVGQKAAAMAMADEHSDVRIAAYQTLAEGSDADNVMLLARAAAKATERNEKEAARQALYRLKGPDVTSAIERAFHGPVPGPARNPEVAIELFRAIGERGINSLNGLLIAMARDQEGRVAQQALRTLQATATAEDIPALAALLADKPGPVLENVVVVTAEKIADRNQRAAALLARFETLESGEAKASYLRVMGRIGDVNALDTIRRMYKSDDKTLRDAAFRAMTDWPGMDFFGQMKQLAKDSPDETQKVLAFRAYVRLAAADETKTADQKVEALAEAMKMAGRVQEQRAVLGALGTQATLQSLELAQAAAANAELKAEAEAAMVSICEQLPAIHAKAVVTAMDLVRTRSDNVELQRKALNIVVKAWGHIGFTTDWEIAGPYAEAGKGAEELFDTVFAPEQEKVQTEWRFMPTSEDPQRPWLMDIACVFGSGANQVAYVRTVIHSPKAREAVFEIGSDDGVKVWLNGQAVHALNVQRPVNRADDKVMVQLKEGDNHVMLKITQAGGNWGFCLRVTNPDGTI